MNAWFGSKQKHQAEVVKINDVLSTCKDKGFLGGRPAPVTQQNTNGSGFSDFERKRIECRKAGMDYDMFSMGRCRERFTPTPESYGTPDSGLRRAS